MSEKGRKIKINSRNVTLMVVALLLLILLVVLIIYFIQSRKNQDDTPVESESAVLTEQTESADDQSMSNETIGDSETESTTAGEEESPNETTSESAVAQEDTGVVTTTTAEVLPAKTYGKWDLSTLSTTTVPYGNSADDVNAVGIPNGVFWYTSKWGQYNVDFISDMGVRYTNGETTEKVIYLTMDCGFDNIYTEQILDTLKEKNVKATFFVTSMFYDARPDLIERMINEGHRIGSHSINHLDMTTLSVEQQTEEIMDVVNKLKQDYDYDCYLFRFPLGNFSDEALALVENLGLKSVFWSYAYNDYSSEQPDVQSSYERAVKYLHPGAIYLLHASSSTNNAFLGDWIDAARAAGYEFGGCYPVD